MLKNRSIKALKDPFLKNSIFIMMTTLFAAVIGFIFWIVAAKLFSPIEIGIATAMVSFLSLILLVSRLGYDQSILRFAQGTNRTTVISSSIILTTIIAIVMALLALISIEFWSQELAIMKNEIILILFFVIFASISTMIGFSFIALRSAHYYFIQNIFMSSRIILLFAFVSFGAFGIFSSVGISFIISSIVSIPFLLRLGIRSVTLNLAFLKNSIEFSVGNYIVNILMFTPLMILPILTLNILGPFDAAIYYIAYAISSMLFVIPNAFATSLIVEGSYGESIAQSTRKTFFYSYFFLIPAMILVIFFGNNILQIIGNDYTNGYDLMLLLCLSAFFSVIISTYISVNRIKKRILPIIKMGILTFLSIISLSFFLMNSFGVDGIGYALIISYLISGSIALFILKRDSLV